MGLVAMPLLRASARFRREANTAPGIARCPLL